MPQIYTVNLKGAEIAHKDGEFVIGGWGVGGGGSGAPARDDKK